MKITRRQLRQVILEACGCGSSQEPEAQSYVDETELSTRFADEASAKAAALISTVTLEDALKMSGIDIDDQLLARIYVAILDVMRDEQRDTHNNIDDEVEAPSVEDAFYPEEVEAREDAWSGGDNIEDPLDHTDFETGESNAGPHVRAGGCGMREVKMKITHRQLSRIIKEEMGQLAVIARMRGQGDREAYASGIYEDDVSEDKSGKGECPDSGCITQRNNKWRIISNKTGKLWPQKYNTKEKAKNALDAYHASR